MSQACPICGAPTLESKRGDYTFAPPPSIPGGDMVIEDAQWQECATCHECILSVELEAALNEQRYHRLGLLCPEEIKSIRETIGLTQVDMAQFLGVGDKTYTRWETGKSIQNRSSDNLIRLVVDHPDLFPKLSAQRTPGRRQQVLDYLHSLAEGKKEAPFSMAAHGDELDATTAQVFAQRIQAEIDRQK